MVTTSTVKPQLFECLIYGEVESGGKENRGKVGFPQFTKKGK